MRTRAKRRAHMENGGPLDDDEWDDLLNGHVRELHRLLTQAFGADYFKKSSTPSTVANVKTIALPADFNKMISLWWNDGSGVPKRMRRATEEMMERQLVGQGWSRPKYAVRAANIEFVPTPTSVYSLILNYAPPAVELVNNADTLDGYNGYEQYPIWMAAADAIAKEEGDASYELGMAQRIASDIITTAERDQSEPMTIQDTTGWYGE